MAVGNTLSTAIDSNESYLGDTLSKIGAKTAVAGAMYLSDKETADTYFNEMVGQEVGNFLAGYASNQMSSFGNATDSKAHLAGLGAATGAISAGISSYASTFVSNRMGGMSARDSFAEAYDGLGSSMIEAAKSSAAKTSRPTAARADLFGMAMDAATNTQRMDFGTIKNLQIVDELNDGEDKAYGAFDSATGKVMVGRELINQAQAGDKDAAAHLLGLLKEELSHREAQAEEQALGIKDFQYDEGALAARQMLKALGEHDGRTVFTFNANDESFDFETSADAINKAVDDKFGWGRILSDRQSGSLEFNSSSVAGMPSGVDSSLFSSMMDMAIGAESDLSSIMSLLDQMSVSGELEELQKNAQSFSDVMGLHELASGDLTGKNAEALQAAINTFNGLEEGAEGALAVDGAFGGKSKEALQKALFSDKAQAAFDWKRDTDLQGYQDLMYSLGSGDRASQDVMLMQSMLVSEDPSGALAGYMNKGVGVGNFGNVTRAAYTESRKNDPELAAIYNQTLTNTGGDKRQLQVTRDGRSIDFNVISSATNIAQAHEDKYTVDAALAKTTPDTYKAMIDASFATEGVTAVGISGAWRPSHGSGTHPAGRGLDINSISTKDGDFAFYAKNRDVKGKAVKNESNVISSFTSNVYTHSNVTQTFTPWSVAKDSSGLKTNYGRSDNDKLHFNHLHFTSRN